MKVSRWPEPKVAKKTQPTDGAAGSAQLADEQVNQKLAEWKPRENANFKLPMRYAPNYRWASLWKHENGVRWRK